MHKSISRRHWLAGAMLAPAAAEERIELPQRVRLALIGLEGHMGEILQPLPAVPQVEIVAMADANPNELRNMARHPRAAKARHYADWRKMLDREQLDMVGIGGDNGSRAEIILAAAARKLHVVSEKPLATSRQDLERIQRAVTANGIRLTMLLPMRFSPPYLAIRQAAASGAIGEVAQMAAQKSYKLGERPEWMRQHSSFGGTIPYIGIHMVDLMRFTSGRELVEAASFQARVGFTELGEMENTTASIFRLDNDGTASLHMDYLRPETAPTHGDDRLRLAGTEGVVEYQAATGVTLVTRREKPRVIQDLPPVQSLFLDFLQSVYKSRPAGLSLRDIYRANEIVLAAREAAESRRIVKT